MSDQNPASNAEQPGERSSDTEALVTRPDGSLSSRAPSARWLLSERAHGPVQSVRGTVTPGAAVERQAAIQAGDSAAAEAIAPGVFVEVDEEGAVGHGHPASRRWPRRRSRSTCQRDRSRLPSRMSTAWH